MSEPITPELKRMQDRINRLQAQVDAVRELHQADDICRNGSHMCNECLDDWPCPTIRALEGDE